MARTVIFDSPFLLGFDQTQALIERISRSHDSYPPYNVEALSDDHLRISIAVAGFTSDQLRVELKGAHLTVTATKTNVEKSGAREGGERDYLHRGIALRGFTRAFVLSDGLEVSRAQLAYGLLHIDLLRPQASDAVKVIPIEAGE